MATSFNHFFESGSTAGSVKKVSKRHRKASPFGSSQRSHRTPWAVAQSIKALLPS